MSAMRPRSIRLNSSLPPVHWWLMMLSLLAVVAIWQGDPTRLPYDDRVIKRIDAQVGDLVRQRRLDESHASAITPVLPRLVRLQSDVPGPR